MVIVLAMPLNPRFVDSNPTESDGFLMVIKNHLHNFLWRGNKAVFSCHKILQHVKDPLRYDRY
jgi:hypothetical protein